MPFTEKISNINKDDASGIVSADFQFINIMDPAIIINRTEVELSGFKLGKELNSETKYDENYVAFNSNTYTLTIKEGVTNIDSSAFYDGEYMGSEIDYIVLDTGSSLVSIGDDAFLEADIEGSITIPKTVKSIGDDAFFNSYFDAVLFEGNLKNLHGEILHDDQIETIGENAFWTSEMDSDVVDSTLHIPKSVKSIGNGAFKESTSANLIFEGQSDNTSALTTIGEYAFASLTIESLKIPSSVEIIKQYAFEDNKLLTDIEFGVYSYNDPSMPKKPTSSTSNLVTIELEAFLYSPLNGIFIPKTVTSIGSAAFYKSELENYETNGGLYFDSTSALGEVRPNLSIAYESFSYATTEWGISGGYWDGTNYANKDATWLTWAKKPENIGAFE